jgi:hypothetical protein
MSPTDRWRRGLGLVFLAVSLLLLVGGFTDAGNSLRGATFLVYWLACAVSAIFALFIALIDLAVVRARGRAERQVLAHRTAAEIEAALRPTQSPAPPKGERPDK